ncbi:hypothetical protein Pelo_12041 [Pelomyxa schiedti]|nr:hypothetical protein Pelo_12041 [Pelomyxa schiedti]
MIGDIEEEVRDIERRVDRLRPSLLATGSAPRRLEVSNEVKGLMHRYEQLLTNFKVEVRLQGSGQTTEQKNYIQHLTTYISTVYAELSVYTAPPKTTKDALDAATAIQKESLSIVEEMDRKLTTMVQMSGDQTTKLNKKWKL